MTIQTSDPATAESALAAVAEAADEAGVTVFAHAIEIDSGAEIGVRSDEPVVAASVFKVPVLVEYTSQVVAGTLDPERRIRVAPGGTPGPTGLSVFSDEADWSLRDLALSMITVSDNAATDIVTGLVGVERVNATMVRLGLPGTQLVGDCNTLFASMVADFGVDDLEAASQAMAADPGRVPELAACTPLSTNRSTPRESTRLLQLLWTDTDLEPQACAEARRILGMQIWPHRLSSGFPRDDVTISGKTGTMGIVRNEIGVVEFPDGRRHAIAVFLRTNEFRYRNPDADRLIGTVAGILSAHLDAATSR